MIVGAGSPGVMAPTFHRVAQDVDAAGGAASFVSDGFESGDLDSPSGPITWVQPSPSTNGSIAVSATNPYAGTYALRFTYNGTADSASSVEQRWSLTSYPGEMWVRFRMFIPSNYVHRDRSPTNNKMWRTWQDDYAGGTNIVGFTLRRSSLGGSNISSAHIEYCQAGSTSMGAWGLPTIDPWITDSDLNSWITVHFHAKMSSSDSANDAELRFGKDGAWSSEATGLDIHDHGGGQRGWNKGYLLGWHNTGYANTTHLDIDDYEVWTTQPSWAVGM